MLDWLESTDLARMVQESIWGYPIVLSGHAVGMAILVGIVLMINFRVLGFAPGVPILPLKALFRVALLGLLINVVSGTMLFMASANSFYESNPFRIKVILLITGGILLVLLSRRIFGPADSAQKTSQAAVKSIAALSIAVWIGVIVAGRLIAYWDFY
ncbi:MAG: hypothetical protein WD795_06500 [Woeseia sp.]